MLNIHIKCKKAPLVVKNYVPLQHLSGSMKKEILFLLCLSTAGFAKSPTRHGVPLSLPDPVFPEANVQTSVEEILSIAFPKKKDVTEALFDNNINAFIANDLISAAKRHIGARYRIGSSGPKSFDCSGFTSFVFGKKGITLKRSSQEQHKQGEAVQSVSDLLPGDLVFFGRGGSKSKHVNHVGIVTEVDPEDGTFSFIHASTSRGVRIDSSTDAYWTRRFMNARRIIGID